MPIAEFRALGYLQEVNRLFLHPHGLALEVTVDDDGTERISGVWDSRDDPEGIYFDELDNARSRELERIWDERAPVRRAALGYVIQPNA